MGPTTIFLSHISEEAALARLLKERLEHSFLNFIDIFVSSDLASLELGTKWLDRITETLQTCAAMVILCSEASLSRPWVNFEAGAGWVRGIPVIPVCHTGMRPIALPLPLNLLQGIQANREADLSILFGTVAGALGSRVPDVDFAGLAAKIGEFEHEYGYLRLVRERVARVVADVPGLEPMFAASNSLWSAKGPINDFVLDRLRPNLDWFKGKGLLDYDLGRSFMEFTTTTGGGGGYKTDTSISMTDDYRRIAPQILA